MSVAESRVVPVDEKTTAARLYNAEGYRQVLALRFAIGDKVRCDGDEYSIREVTSIELTLQDTILYGLDFKDAIWCDEELKLVEEVVDTRSPEIQRNRDAERTKEAPMTDIHITVHIEADRIAAALEILAGAILGTPASKAEGTQFQLQPVRGHEGADPAPVVAVLEQQAAAPAPAAPLPPAALTIEDVRAKLNPLMKAGQRAKINEALATLEVVKLTDLDPARFPELLKLLGV